MNLLKMKLGVLMVVLFWAVGTASSKDCAPPNFYASLPRDNEWFYGVARDADTDKARDASVRNLGKQVSGGIEGWDERQIEKVAGPGHDRTTVGQAIETVLNQTPLSGWEQDDFQRCNGFSYVLVRVRKEQAMKFLSENAKFRNAVLERLEKRVARIGDDLDSMKASYEKLRVEFEALKRDQRNTRVPMQIGISRDRLEKILGSVKAGLDRGKADPQVQGKLLEAVSVMAGIKAEDLAALEKYESVVGLEGSAAGPDRKVEAWRSLSQEFPAFADVANAKVGQWEARARQRQADDQILTRNMAARDEDWSKLFRLLALTTISKDEKAKWALQFVETFISSPGIEPWMAARIVRVLPQGAMRARIGKIAKSPVIESALKPIEVDKKYGYADRRGHLIIPPQYDRADDFSEGLAAVTIINTGPNCATSLAFDRAGNWIPRCERFVGYINESGEMKIEPKFMSGRRFKSGLAAVSDSDGRWGVIDHTGRVVGKIQFDSVRAFSEGYAPVQMGGSKIGGDLWKDGRWGYIDERGEFVIEPQFREEPGAFISGRALVHTESGFVYIDYKGVQREP